MRRLFAIASLLTLSVFLLIAPIQIAFAQGLDVNPDPKTVAKGLIPSLKCDPTNSDFTQATGTHLYPGCGPNAALQLVYNVISYVGYIVVPIATLLLGYAGFRIMTAAGDSEQLGEAKSMMKKVVIGIVLIFLSTMIVRYVFVLLKVGTEFTPEVESVKK